MKYIYTIFLTALTLGAWSQSTEEAYPIGELMAKYEAFNRGQEFVEGWRIQLFATTDRLKMEKELELIQTNFPELEYNWEHASPYYRVRVGAFLNKLQAYQVMQGLKSDFQGAFLLRDAKIRPEELLKY